MSRLAEFRAAEKALQEQIAQLEALKQDAGLKREIEFEQKLLGLMKTYEKGLRDIVAILDPKGSSKPLEGHLVLKGPDISGNVTSCEYSQSLDKIIGLAYAAFDQSQPGQQIPIRVEDGVIVQATVVKLPFFDPENQRQEL